LRDFLLVEGGRVRYQKVGVLLVGVLLATLAAFSGLFIAYLAQLGCDGSDTHGPSNSGLCSGSTENVWIYAGWGAAIVGPLAGMAWALAAGGWRPLWLGCLVGGAALLVLFMLMFHVQGGI